MKSAVVLLAFVGMVFANDGEHGGGRSGEHGGGQSGEHGGGQSGEHGAKNCSIVPSTTTSCSGVTGTSCISSTSLQVNYFCCHYYIYFSSLELFRFQ